MTKKSLKPVASAIGAAFAGSMLLAGAANAAENPFGLTELNSGYMQMAGSHGGGEGKCGAGKCGGEKKDGEGKCGEGKCGGEKKDGEGKCGAGKCGGDKKAD
jgi:uncharacterized low-complexity protein